MRMLKAYETTVRSWSTRVKQLLGSRKAAPALLEFLAFTRVGKRTCIEDQEQKERRRRHNETWSLDEERLKGEEEREENGEMGSEEVKERGQIRRG